MPHLYIYATKYDILSRDRYKNEKMHTYRTKSHTLWYLETNVGYRTIGHLFGVSKSTVCVITKNICTAIASNLLPKCIRTPCGDNLKDAVDGFEHKWGFPRCAGAVDGTHIPIVSPEECPDDYYNRKGWHSALMQDVVNHLGHFTNVYVGWPGRVHDTKVFANSALNVQGQKGTLSRHGTNELVANMSHLFFWETLRMRLSNG